MARAGSASSHFAQDERIGREPCCGGGRIAQAYNCFGVRVEDPADLQDALRAAVASGQPAVVDVVIDPEDSDSGERRPWRSYWSGRWAAGSARHLLSLIYVLALTSRVQISKRSNVGVARTLIGIERPKLNSGVHCLCRSGISDDIVYELTRSNQ